MKYFIYGLLGALFVVIGSESYAATTRPISVDPKSISAFLFTPNNLDGVILGNFETIATTPQNQQVTRYTTRPVPLPKARLGSLARSAVGGPAVLAATAAFLAYDYFYNEDTGQWETEVQSGVTGVGTCSLQFGGSHPDVTFTQCYEMAGNLSFNGTRPTGYTVTVLSSSALRLVAQHGPGVTLTHQWSRVGPGSNNTPYLPGSTAITDDQAGDAIKDAPPQAVSDILNDPIQSGTWRDRWPEMEPVTQEIEDQLGHDIEGAPAPVNPDQTITDSSTYNPPQTDTGSGGSMSTEWPTFCSWAGVVCDFIDWVQEPFAEPPPVEVPYVDIDFEEDYDSGIAIAQCPAPIAMNITLGSSVRAINFEWTPLCTFADTVRPLIIAFSYLIGIYILLRVK